MYCQEVMMVSLLTGTTNVDFNQPVIPALSRINKAEKVLLCAAKNEVSVPPDSNEGTERKVP